MNGCRFCLRAKTAVDGATGPNYRVYSADCILYFATGAAFGAERGAAMHGLFRSRTVALAIAVASIALSAGVVVAGPAEATPGSPTVTAGSGAPSSADLSTTTFDLANAGYQASEFYLAGSA